MRTTKFRHLKGTILGKETHITNFSGLSKTIPGECDAFKVNSKYAAVPIGPSCNQLAIIQITKGRRLSGGIIPHLVCGHGINDFAFDPFNDERIAVGCENGTIQLWSIPEGGFTENLDKFDAKLVAHNDRITIVEFHPLASDVLASFSMDLTLIIWDLKSLDAKIRINNHPEPVFGISWSPNGRLLATICKDQVVRIFEPRAEQQLLQEGPGPQGIRGGRVCWAQNGSLLIASGFSRLFLIKLILENVKHCFCVDVVAGSLNVNFLYTTRQTFPMSLHLKDWMSLHQYLFHIMTKILAHCSLQEKEIRQYSLLKFLHLKLEPHSFTISLITTHRLPIRQFHFYPKFIVM